MKSQINIFEPIIIDFFAGGGGASTGIELALGKPVTIAINHNEDAIRMHKTNHPYTIHYQEDVWKVNPKEVCMGRHVGLAWFSPDCKHFSKAKGAALVDKKIRGLAWVVLRWAAEVRPDVIFLENVEEFKTWCPTRKGKPVKSKSGITFQKWIKQLRDLGYKVEHKELVAADYGAPTTRKRLYLIARCDGKPIVWPKPTHSKTGNDGKKKWRSAAEIIDWSIPCYSIFETKEYIKEKYGRTVVRPLAENTLKRIIRGVDKFTIKSGNPYIVHKGQLPRVHDIDNPLSTVVLSEKQYLCTPSLMALGQTSGRSNRIRDIQDPAFTQVSKAETCIIAPSLTQYHTENKEAVRGQTLSEPVMTVDSSNRYGLSTAHLTKYYSGLHNAQSLEEPLHTIVSKDRAGLTIAHISKYFTGVDGAHMDKPLPTITAIDHNSLALTNIAEFKGQDIGQPVTNPLRTITTSARQFGSIHTTVTKYDNNIDLKFWPEVRELLNKYCDYTLSDDEILLIWIDNIPYFITDIKLRMLMPRELYNANGFPPDYIIDHDYAGKTYSKSAQVARCGNAVCPPVAKALVQANYASKRVNIETMKQLNVAVTAV